MHEVVTLHPPMVCVDVVAAMRAIADDIEAGRYEFEPTMAVVVIGCETERRVSDGMTLNFNWQTHGLGKTSFFAAKGLLACATAKFEGFEG